MIARLLAVLLGLAAVCGAQTSWWSWWSYKGYLENRTLLYPRGTEAVNETFLRFESTFRLPAGVKVFSGMDAQTDTENQVGRAWHLSWTDRDLQRPAMAVRTWKVQYTRGPLRVEAGKQVLHWGVMDLFSPTDRFAPRDLLSPSGSDYLGVFSVRAVVDTGRNSVELVYLPVFTPSRVPLENQRWFIRPASSFQYIFAGTEYPGGPQFGARYHRVQSAAEFSLSYFDGFWNLPSASYQINPFAGTIKYRANYAKTQMIGGDFTMPWRGLVWKAESAYITSPSAFSDNYWTYAMQAERANDKWQLAAGYTGEHTTELHYATAADIDRALRKSFTGRVGWTPTTKQSLSGEWFLRQNGSAFITRIVYSRSLPSSLRATVGWIGIVGHADDAIGRYGRNSYLTLQLRRSF